ncbi:histidinol phosphate phosphatase [Clostridium sp.]|uniref:histidinol phosphate phosphatase n=1 Tax=Clostridium sp. TaxID=1506 RepID=UPI002FC9EBE4
MIFDTHIHTSFSTDSKMNIKDAIQRAKSLNIGLIITDHMDLNYPEKDKFVFDIKRFFETYEPYRSSSLLLGIELGMDTKYENENKLIVDNYNFDEIIGSQHFLHGFDIYEGALYEGRIKEDLFRDYFLEIIHSLKTHSYIDTLGHIDFISRYYPLEDKEIYYEDYCDYIDEVLKLCINNDIAMEINTRRLSNITAFNNLTKIFKRYKDLGGKYVTLGSDAHTLVSIGSNLDKGFYIADSVNLIPVYFKNRKMNYIKK